MYAVMTGRPRSEVLAAIQQHYPQHIMVSDCVWLIKARGPARDVSDKLFKETGVKNAAVVFRVNADYYGYAKSEIWTWIARTFEEERDG